MEIESQWTAWKRERAGILPTVRVRQPAENPAQAELGRATLESRNARDRLRHPPVHVQKRDMIVNSRKEATDLFCVPGFAGTEVW